MWTTGAKEVYKRVYNGVDKMQIEIKVEETERLQMTKHERPSKIDDERVRIIEILREYFPRTSLNGQEQQDRPCNNEVRQKEKQSNETNEVMVSEATVYEMNEKPNTVSKIQ